MENLKNKISQIINLISMKSQLSSYLATGLDSWLFIDIKRLWGWEAKSVLDAWSIIYKVVSYHLYIWLGR